MSSSPAATTSCQTPKSPLIGENVLGVIRWLGGLLTLAGLATLGYWGYRHYSQVTPGPDEAFPLFLGCGLTFFGLPLWSLVWNVTLDHSQGQVMRKVGAVGLVKTTAYPLQQFSKIRIRRVETDGSWLYQVVIVSRLENGREECVLFTQSDEREIAVRKAQQAADYLTLPVEETGAAA